MNFDSRKWEDIRENSGRWWDGTLERPLITAALSGYERDVPKPSQPFFRFASFYDDSITVEEIVDVWDYYLSEFRYFGDSFPSMIPNFGPGVIAAFVGAELKNGEDTVWFDYPKTESVSRVELNYDASNYWLKRIKDIFKCAADRWDGNVLVRMTDLGGNLDVLASLRGTQNLIMDLYDDPDGVKDLTWREHEIWWRYFEEIHSVARGVNKGYSSWDGIYSEKPYYMLQCDFAYMLTPKLFDEFVKPELVKTSEKLGNAFYHLDGVGQLQHLDSILEIDSIKGIQWVPGAGQPDISNWAEVYQKIHKASKLIQFWDNQYDKGSLEILDIIVDQIGTAKGIDCVVVGDRSREDEVSMYLEKYGVE